MHNILGLIDKFIERAMVDEEHVLSDAETLLNNIDLTGEVLLEDIVFVTTKEAIRRFNSRSVEKDSEEEVV